MLKRIGAIGLAVCLMLISRPLLAADQEPPGTEGMQGVIEDGQKVYSEDCASCHGKSAKGDGVLAAVLNVKPPDLTQIAKRNNGNFDVWKVYGTIDGRHMLRAHGENQMPVWGSRYSREWGFAGMRGRYLELIYYLRSIQEK